MKVEPKVSEKTVQETYAVCARNGWMCVLKEFYELTKIEPKIPEDIVQAGYIACFKKNQPEYDFETRLDVFRRLY